MKTIRYILVALLLISASNTICAKNRTKEKGHDKWLVMMGYGYAYTTDKSVSGTGGMSSIVYLPHKIWGFGLDMGTVQTEGVSRNWTGPMQYGNHYDIQNNWFVGPGVYLFPVNSKWHRLHLSLGGNVFRYSRNYIHKTSGQNYEENGEIDTFHGQEAMWNVGFHAGLGYSVKFLEHFELGLRAAASFYQEGFNLNANLNLSVAFQESGPGLSISGLPAGDFGGRYFR